MGIKRFLRELFTFHTGAWLLLFWYVGFLLRFHFKEGLEEQTFSLLNVSILALSALSLLCLHKILTILTFNKKLPQFFINFVLIITYMVFGIYYLRTGTPMEFSLVQENKGLIFYKESMGLFFEIPRQKDLIQFASLIAAVLFLQFKYKLFWKIKPIHKPLAQLPILLVLFLGILTQAPYLQGEINKFFKSAYQYYNPPESIIPYKKPEKGFPLIRKASAKEKAESGRPHIFMIFVESFNANFVEKKAPNGKEYTPFFNSLIKKGVYFENFYGNSIQTSKGQFASLCSLLPLIHEKVFTDHPKKNFHCLPKILKKQQYNTVFTKGFSDISFDNTKNFVERIGFEHVFGMDSRFVSKEERDKYYWGWGIQDNIYYKKVFQHLDKLHSQDPEEPFFVSFTTISNHMKFKKTPRDQRYIYPDQDTDREYYGNTLRVTDEYLKEFFQQLKKRDYLENSLVMILGDHSFPMGEHGNYSSENGFYNENFKTPLLLLWPKELSPKRISPNRSQIDIAPTLTSLLGIEKKTHFTGKGLFRDGHNKVHLVQPYAGTFLSLITRDNIKYVYNERTRQEYAYDLSKDPMEKENIIDEISPKELEKMREQMSVLYLNDWLIRNDRIWPQSSDKVVER